MEKTNSRAKDIEAYMMQERSRCIALYLVGWGIKDTTYGKSNKYHFKNYSMTRQRKHLAGWSMVHVQ
jgi:hypothetical protein